MLGRLSPEGTQARPDDVVNRAEGGHVCQRADAPTPFDDITSCVGLDATRTMLQDYYVTGQAFADYDRDGHLDLYVTDSRGPNTLYKNLGDGTFGVSELNDQVAAVDANSGGAVFADFDNDGWLDLYVLNVGPNILYRNDEGRGFVDVTDIANVGDKGKGETASFGDFDSDGFLDLYVANWLCDQRCERGGPEGARDRLFHNEGDGTFTDVSPLLGDSELTGAGFVAGFVDYDSDGDLDIYLVNDKGYEGPPAPGSPMNRNLLWENQGSGCGLWCFEERAIDAGADVRLDGMGLAIGDYDEDGDQDMFMTNIDTPVLLQNQGDRTFINVTKEANIQHDRTSWGTVLLDYDNDGDLDLYYAVGLNLGFENPNHLLQNLGDGTFAYVSKGSGADAAAYTIGVAMGDYDNDGAVDIVIGNWARGYRLLRNKTNDREKNRWVTIDLVGGGSVNRDAIGSKVVVVTSDGRRRERHLQCGSSLGAGSELALHFGLGVAHIERIEVTWPNGRVSEVTDVAVRTRVEIVYPFD